MYIRISLGILEFAPSHSITLGTNSHGHMGLTELVVAIGSSRDVRQYAPIPPTCAFSFLII
jgi:hypothetical protein